MNAARQKLWRRLFPADPITPAKRIIWCKVIIRGLLKYLSAIFAISIVIKGIWRPYTKRRKELWLILKKYNKKLIPKINSHSSCMFRSIQNLYRRRFLVCILNIEQMQLSYLIDIETYILILWRKENNKEIIQKHPRPFIILWFHPSYGEG